MLKTQVAPTHPYGVIEGTGGYVYEKWPDGRIRILSSPREGAGKFITRDNAHYADVLAEINQLSAGAAPGMKDAAPKLEQMARTVQPIGGGGPGAIAAPVTGSDVPESQWREGMAPISTKPADWREGMAPTSTEPQRGHGAGAAAGAGNQPLALNRRVRGQPAGVLDGWTP